MDIKIICKKDNYKLYEEKLKKAGFTINPMSHLTFKEDDYTPESVIGKKDDYFEIIHYHQIVFIESFGHEKILHTLSDTFTINEKIYEIEGMFSNHGFIRISKSIVINKKMISKIKPLLNSKYQLIMKDNSVVYVSRSYLQNFKENIGL
ncbi:histidine kinase [Candidatus Izimaplasma bacterium ZiA1]|uniref:LytTR family DNA-binding domain-containing protein n=1 Tax=Candidatus Izimoplasma sp. ZiA1 TaxID=2024899 RepID=UPI000BAA6CAA|nr:histidine kinase [Candidatus Izimaplasma bacterium ZiA1]